MVSEAKVPRHAYVEEKKGKKWVRRSVCCFLKDYSNPNRNKIDLWLGLWANPRKNRLKIHFVLIWSAVDKRGILRAAYRGNPPLPPPTKASFWKQIDLRSKRDPILVCGLMTVMGYDNRCVFLWSVRGDEQN